MLIPLVRVLSLISCLERPWPMLSAIWRLTVAHEHHLTAPAAEQLRMRRKRAQPFTRSCLKRGLQLLIRELATDASRRPRRVVYRTANAVRRVTC
jgi:hypothetical protein